TPPTGVTSGAFDVSVNFTIGGEVVTPNTPFPGSAQVGLTASSFLAVNTDPVSLLPLIQQFGFGAFTVAGRFNSFGDGTFSGDGVFAGVGPTSSIFVNATTPTITAHVGDMLTVVLALSTTVSEASFTPGFLGVKADLSHTISFATDRPVFNLPDG